MNPVPFWIRYRTKGVRLGRWYVGAGASHEMMLLGGSLLHPGIALHVGPFVLLVAKLGD